MKEWEKEGSNQGFEGLPLASEYETKVEMDKI